MSGQTSLNEDFSSINEAGAQSRNPPAKDAAAASPSNRSNIGRLPKPKEPEYIASERCWLYRGRKFYDSNSEQNNGSMQSELCYLRDYKAWADEQLVSFNAFSRSVNEALNSGDGSYRP